MTCAEIEVLLCDYVDGTLGSSEKNQVEAHLCECAACAESVSDAGAAMALISRAAVVEPPAELVNRILFRIPGRQQARLRGLGWLRGKFATVLQPRFAMGMAMTILSFSMLGRFAGINHSLKPDDLRPDKVWVAFDDKIHRSWERAVKYYDNLRFVYEIQSRLNEMGTTEAEPATGKNGQAVEEKRK